MSVTARDTGSIEMEKEELEATCCVWKSRDLGLCVKIWDTDCNDTYVKLEEDCPACDRRVVLVGFDAWWERRKSYHP